MSDFQAVERILEHINDQDGHWYGPRIESDDAFQKNAGRFAKQDCELDGIDFEMVDQRAQGMDGDSFYGEMAWPLPCGKWLTIGFSV